MTNDAVGVANCLRMIADMIESGKLVLQPNHDLQVYVEQSNGAIQRFLTDLRFVEDRRLRSPLVLRLEKQAKEAKDLRLYGVPLEDLSHTQLLGAAVSGWKAHEQLLQERITGSLSADQFGGR